MKRRFNQSRLQAARQRRRLLQKELASACEVTPQTVTNWETGATLPSAATISRLSKLLAFPEEFFYLEDMEPLSEGDVTFRSRARTPAREKHAALTAGAMARELAAWIMERFELPAVDLPDLHEVHDPELAAEIVRAEFGLGDGPIRNLIRILESRGALVFSLAQDCLEIDAFSFWSHDRPIVLLNTMKSSERSRLDAAHELGHLVLHRDEETAKTEERQANHFAGAFLMPSRDMLTRFPSVHSLTHLIQSKTTIGASLAALVYRLNQLGVINDWQYRALTIELSKRGYRKNEPNPIPRETSVVLPKVFDHLKSNGMRIRHIAKDLSWNPEHLSELIFGLGATLLAVDGGGRRTTTRKPRLRSV